MHSLPFVRQTFVVALAGSLALGCTNAVGATDQTSGADSDVPRATTNGTGGSASGDGGARTSGSDGNGSPGGGADGDASIGSAGDDSSAGPTVSGVIGTYATSDASAPIASIAFLDATHYSAWVNRCTGTITGTGGCPMDGTYTLDATTNKLALHDDASNKDATFTLTVGAAAAAPGDDGDGGGSGLVHNAGPLVCKVTGDPAFSTVAINGAPLVRSSACGTPVYSIAYIGDSHSDYEGNARGAFGFLGQHLGELMQTAEARLSLFAASNSSPTWWFDGTSVQAATWGYTQSSPTPPRKDCTRGSQTGTCVPKLSVILANHPDLFVIEQGTNLIGDSTSLITSQIQTMLSQVAGKSGQCLWVSAPNASTSAHSTASQNALWTLVQQYVGASSCYLYDSRFLPETDSAGKLVLDANGKPVQDVPLPYQGTDGEHFSMTPAGQWAEGVGRIIGYLRSQAGK